MPYPVKRGATTITMGGGGGFGTWIGAIVRFVALIFPSSEKKAVPPGPIPGEKFTVPVAMSAEMLLKLVPGPS